ncbi:hypothetical protein PAPYR_3207 [Paratrimastix pyriformis]|uniref:Protein kinase domain-containing protein n=1 Tax=Paratrimastix pyriformis TaxID=342808 RepID=A0ABQ8UN18_9EUKA|nr:hypothetical protein PAPYR_3207 [Paratrimastix pyriformis]
MAGALSVGGSAHLVAFQCHFADNTANTNGGAIDAESSALFLLNCSFNTNWCANDGGALYMAQSSLINSTLSFLDAHWWVRQDNEAFTGGAIFVDGSTFMCEGCFGSGNTADDQGGWAEVRASELTVSQCRIEGVPQRPGGGLYVMHTQLLLAGSVVYSTLTRTEIQGSLLEANEAGSSSAPTDAPVFCGGGGLYVSGGDVRVSGGTLLADNLGAGAAIDSQGPLGRGSLAVDGARFGNNSCVPALGGNVYCADGTMQFNETDFGVAGEPWVYCIADQCSNDLGLSRCGLPPPKATLVRGQCAGDTDVRAVVVERGRRVASSRPCAGGRPASLGQFPDGITWSPEVQFTVILNPLVPGHRPAGGRLPGPGRLPDAHAHTPPPLLPAGGYLTGSVRFRLALAVLGCVCLTNLKKIQSVMTAIQPLHLGTAPAATAASQLENLRVVRDFGANTGLVHLAQLNGTPVSIRELPLDWEVLADEANRPTTTLIAEHCERGSLHTAASALAFMHASTPPIVYRYLSSHVLMMSYLGIGTSDVFRQAITDANSIAWTAPELVREEAPGTTAANVFSFGVIMWELATRADPYAKFAGGPPLALVATLRDLQYMPSFAVPQSCGAPSWYVALMERCLHPDPQQRPDADAIRYELYLHCGQGASGGGAGRSVRSPGTDRLVSDEEAELLVPLTSAVDPPPSMPMPSPGGYTAMSIPRGSPAADSPRMDRHGRGGAGGVQSPPSGAASLSRSWVVTPEDALRFGTSLPSRFAVPPQWTGPQSMLDERARQLEQ